MVMDDVPLSMVERFAALEDPRTGNAKRHQLLDIIVIALCFDYLLKVLSL